METKFVRIGRSGPTIDGRHIPAALIDQAAASYDPAVYQARISVEHFRSWLPDGPFRMYGDVLALRAETDGDERVLLARLDITEDLASILGKRQKTHWSMELAENFAGTGGAYLVGLAATDQPASLATEALKFAAASGPALLYGGVYEAGALEASDETAAPTPAPANIGQDQMANRANKAARPLLGSLTALLAGSGRRPEGTLERTPAHKAGYDPNGHSDRHVGDRSDDRYNALVLVLTDLAEEAAARRADSSALAAQLAALTARLGDIGTAQEAVAKRLAQEAATPERPLITGDHSQTMTDI